MPSDRVFCSYISRNERYIQFSPSKNKPDYSGVLVLKVILFVSKYGPSLDHQPMANDANRQIHYFDDKTEIPQKNFTIRDN